MLLWRLIFYVRSRLSKQEQRTSWQYKMACILLHYQVQIPEFFWRSGRRGRIFFWRNCPNLFPGRKRHKGQRLGWLACSPKKKISLFLIFNTENLTYMQIDPSSWMTPTLSKTTPYTSLFPKPNLGHSTMWKWYEPEFSRGKGGPGPQDIFPLDSRMLIRKFDLSYWYIKSKFDRWKSIIFFQDPWEEITIK